MGNERGEWKVFYSISACQALLNCCVGCLVTVILRDTSAESVLNKTPTIFSHPFYAACVLSFLHLSVSGCFYKWILLEWRKRKRLFLKTRFLFVSWRWRGGNAEPQLWRGTCSSTAGRRHGKGGRSGSAEGEDIRLILKSSRGGGDRFLHRFPSQPVWRQLQTNAIVY